MFNNSIYRKTRYYASTEHTPPPKKCSRAAAPLIPHPASLPQPRALQNITKNCCQRHRRMLSLLLSLSIAKCKMYLNLSPSTTAPPPPLLLLSRPLTWPRRGLPVLAFVAALTCMGECVRVSVCVCTLKFMQMLRCVPMVECVRGCVCV